MKKKGFAAKLLSIKIHTVVIVTYLVLITFTYYDVLLFIACPAEKHGADCSNIKLFYECTCKGLY